MSKVIISSKLLKKTLLGPEFKFAAHDPFKDVRTPIIIVNLPSYSEERKHVCKSTHSYEFKGC